MRARWVPWEPEGMCMALYPMEYDALSVEAAVLEKPWVQKAEEKKRGILKSLSGVLAPVRQGLMVCFLLLLFFVQNRLEMRFCIANPSRKSLEVSRCEVPLLDSM
jgi:hypothetical protein